MVKAILVAAIAYVLINLIYRLLFTNEKDNYPVKKTRKNINAAPKSVQRETRGYEDWDW